MSSQPLCSVNDRTDFMGWDGARMRPMLGTVIEVIEGPIQCRVQMEHQYRIRSDNQIYRVAESDVSTPFGKCDDAA